MNILYLCDEYPPGKHGGIGTVVQLLGREMVRQGHNVVVAGFYDWGYAGDDVFTDQGVKVYRFRRKLASSFFNSNSIPVRAANKLLTASGIFQWDIKKSLANYHTFLEKLIKKHSIDIVEMPDYNDYIRFCKSPVFFPKLSVPTVVKLHGTLTYFTRESGNTEPGFIYKTELDILEKATVVASVSKYTADKTAVYFAYTKPVPVLYNGIAPSKTGTITKIDNKVVYTGSLAAKKGIYQLMKAWNIVNTHIPDATLDVYGKGPLEKIQPLLNDKAIITVTFKGHISREELTKELAAASVAVFPSYAECFALGPMEAMACGTATIYTKRTSGSELIDDGKDGILIDPDNVNELAEKIILLLQNSELRTEIATNGKNKITDWFDIHIIGKNHADFYTKVLSGAG